MQIVESKVEDLNLAGGDIHKKMRALKGSGI
jgi:hypothetical protein